MSDREQYEYIFKKISSKLTSDAVHTFGAGVRCTQTNIAECWVPLYDKEGARIRKTDVPFKPTILSTPVLNLEVNRNKGFWANPKEPWKMQCYPEMRGKSCKYITTSYQLLIKFASLTKL